MSKDLQSISEALADIIRSKKLAILCGAGVSLNSGLPLANDLKLLILNGLELDFTDIQTLMKSELPFEAFIEELCERTDISDILNIFKSGKPNVNHLLIARLIKKGYIKKVVTTNFDLLLEKALENEGMKSQNDFCVYWEEEKFRLTELKENIAHIVKIHGNAIDFESIRTTLSEVSSNKFSNKRRFVVNDLFSSGYHEAVLIFGYSCSDIFDIIPQIEMIENNFKYIIFIEHSDQEKIEDIKISDIKNPFKNFPGIRISCNTDKFIELLWKEILSEKYYLTKSITSWKDSINNWINSIQLPIRFLISGALLYQISQFNKSIVSINKGLVNSGGDKKIAFLCHLSLSCVYSEIPNEYLKAKEHSECAITLSNELNEKSKLSSCYINLGNSYFKMGSAFIDKSRKCYLNAITNGKSENMKLDCIMSFINLGNIEIFENNFEKALEYFELGRLLAKEEGFQKGLISCYGGLGVSHALLKNNNESKKWIDMTIKLAKQMGDVYAVYKSYYNLAKIYSNDNDIDQEIDCYARMIEALEEIDLNKLNPIDEKILIGYCETLGRFYLSSKEFERAIKFFNWGLDLATKYNDKENIKRCYSGLSYILNLLDNSNKPAL